MILKEKTKKDRNYLIDLRDHMLSQYGHSLEVSRQVIELLDALITDDVNASYCYDLKISKLSGKMQGLVAISSNTNINSLCEKYATIPGTVCSHCYAKKFLKTFRRNANLSYLLNYLILNYTQLESWQLPKFNPFKNKHVRLEAFGELESMDQLNNYIKIVNYNPGVNFAIWSKNYKLIREFLKNNAAPKNLIIVLSELKINESHLLQFRKSLLNFKTIDADALKVFKVVDAASGDVVNCAKRCFDCLKCYDKNGITNIVEGLK